MDNDEYKKRKHSKYKRIIIYIISILIIITATIVIQNQFYKKIQNPTIISHTATSTIRPTIIPKPTEKVLQPTKLNLPTAKPTNSKTLPVTRRYNNSTSDTISYVNLTISYSAEEFYSKPDGSDWSHGLIIPAMQINGELSPRITIEGNEVKTFPIISNAIIDLVLLLGEPKYIENYNLEAVELSIASIPVGETVYTHKVYVYAEGSKSSNNTTCWVFYVTILKELSHSFDTN